MKIALQGISGSFNEVAALEFSQRHHFPEVSLSYAVSAENVLAAIENHEADYGVVAIVNNQGGLVKETLKAITVHRCSYVDQLTLPIHHALLVLSDLASNDLTEVCSHPQALKQCTSTLKANYPNASTTPMDDTALSAKLLSEGKLPKTAGAIAHARCAEIYGLKVLQDNLQDRDDNQTTFLLLSPLS